MSSSPPVTDLTLALTDEWGSSSASVEPTWGERTTKRMWRVNMNGMKNLHRQQNLTATPLNETRFDPLPVIVAQRTYALAR